jgi:hypothetical protein
VKGIKQLLLPLLSVIDPKGDLVFSINRAINRIEVPTTSMSGTDLSNLLAELSKERIVLEFGSGGSTFLFSENAMFTTSVESDKYFLKLIRKALLNKVQEKNTYLYWASIGPTKSYGQPLWSLQRFFRHRYVNYYNKIFQKSENSRKAQIVFIDGRFRVACAMSSLLNIKQDFKIIVDDYFDRPEYSEIENVLGKPLILVGNTAIFEVKIESVNLDLVEKILKQYSFDPR